MKKETYKHISSTHQLPDLILPYSSVGSKSNTGLTGQNHGISKAAFLLEAALRNCSLWKQVLETLTVLGLWLPSSILKARDKWILFKLNLCCSWKSFSTSKNRVISVGSSTQEFPGRSLKLVIVHAGWEESEDQADGSRLLVAVFVGKETYKACLEQSQTE